MKKLLVVLIGLVALVAFFIYSNQDVVTYELGQNDVVVSNGEYRFIGRVSSGNLVEKVEVYHEKGEKLKEFALEDITNDALSDARFFSDMRFKKDEFNGLQLTTEKEGGKDKILYHFEHAGVTYKHKLLPLDSHARFFHWSKLQSQEE